MMNFAGVAGVHLGLLADVERVAWLYVPCLTLLLGAAAIQLSAPRWSGHKDDDRPGGGIA